MAGFANNFNSGEGSVRALEAGADVLLMPPNPETSDSRRARRGGQWTD